MAPGRPATRRAPPAGELQALLERQDPRTGELPGELGAGVEGSDFRQRVIAHRPGAVGLPPELAVMKEDVMAVLRDPDVDLNPLHGVGDGELQGPRGILGRLVHRSAMGHNLNRASWLDRLEEWEARASDFRPRAHARGPEHDSPGEHDRCHDGHGELSSPRSRGNLSRRIRSELDQKRLPRRLADCFHCRSRFRRCRGRDD